MAVVTTTSPGVFARWRSRLFGEQDPVEQQLADIARQGAGLSRVAHLCASALLILFSAASFVALGSDTYAQIAAQWGAQHTLNVPAAISLSVVTLMVMAFDVGMIYAASMLRLLATRRAGFGERWVHVIVMVGVAVIEAATYCYMAYRFERPGTGLAWALIVMRAAAAPLLAVYLSMARALPVTARDILAQAELASGAGVIRDVIVLANDRDASLADKLALYGASAVMTPADKTHLDAMIGVMRGRTSQDVTIEALDIAPVRALAGAGASEGDEAAPSTSHEPRALQRVVEGAAEPPTRPPTGPGSPSTARGMHKADGAVDHAPRRPAILRLEPPPEWADDRRKVAQGSTHTRGVRTPSRPRKRTRKSAATTASVEAKARAVWQPGMTVSALQTAAGISRSMAGKYRKVFLAEAETSEPAQVAQ